MLCIIAEDVISRREHFLLSYNVCIFTSERGTERTDLPSAAFPQYG